MDSRKQKGTSIFSWTKHKFRISFPFFSALQTKLGILFFSTAYWKGLSSTSLLHLAVGTMGEKDLWTWVSAQMNLQFQFHLFKFIFFLSWVFQRHLFFLCLCTVISSVLFPTLPTQQHFPSYVLCFDLSSPSPPPNVLFLHQETGAQPLGGKKKQLVLQRTRLRPQSQTWVHISGYERKADERLVRFFWLLC